MQILALILGSAIALVTADTRTHGKYGNPSGHAWVRDFDNLVAFGDRSGIPSGLPEQASIQILTDA